MAPTFWLRNFLLTLLMCTAGVSYAVYEEKPISLESNDQFMQILAYAEANQKELDLALGPMTVPSKFHAEEKVVAQKVAELNKILAQDKALTNNEKAYISELIGDLYLTIRYNDPRYPQFYFNAGSILYTENPIGSMAHARGIELLKRYYLSKNKLSELQRVSVEATDEQNVRALSKFVESSDINKYCIAKIRVLTDLRLTYQLDWTPQETLSALQKFEEETKGCLDHNTAVKLYRDYAITYSDLEDFDTAQRYHREVVRIYKSNNYLPDSGLIHHVGMVLQKIVRELAEEAKTSADRTQLLELHAPIETLYTGTTLDAVKRLEQQSKSSSTESVVTLSPSKLQEARSLIAILKEWIREHPEDDLAANTYVISIQRIDDRPAIDYAFRKIENSAPNDYWSLQAGYSLLSTLYSLKGLQQQAILYQQIAVSYSIDSYNEWQRSLQKINSELATKVKWIYESDVKQLQRLYQNSGRLEEALQLNDLLKSFEYLQFTRTSSKSSGPITERMLLTKAEEETISSVKAISARPSNGTSASKQPQILAIVDAAASSTPTKPVVSSSSLDKTNIIEIVRKLGTSVSLLSYTVHKDGVSIDVVSQAGVNTFFVPIEDKLLNELIAKFIQGLRNRDSDPSVIANKLYGVLISPVEELLRKLGSKTLMVSLDGHLRYIPFSALYDGSAYAIEKWSFPVYTALTRQRLADPPHKSWSVAGFGVTKQWGGLSPLPEVKQELNSIVRSGGGVLEGDIYLDDSFTQRSLQKATKMNYKVVHIASHFIFSPGTEADSYLLLGNGQQMSLTDIKKANLRFDHADLLTLSACDTARGGGTDANGREIEGFGVLVQKQGAKSVLATLWRVDDKATSTLMSEAYLQKSKGSNKIESIRSAQLKLLHSSKYKHPFYWAPFVLMGNWQ